MCGIVGYISPDHTPLDQQVAALRHRGPDYEASELYDTCGGKVGFGHTRLSIVDLTAQAHQPFHSEDGQYSIVYNGEIYNHLSLRARLEKNGVTFKTTSDTEVLLAMYARFGEKALAQLDGIFSFAILDRNRNELFCARDQLGIKPFYYFENLTRQCFYFASELKALFKFTPVPKRISSDGITEFLLNGWVYEPDCGLEQIKKIPPGHWLSVNLRKHTLRIEPYYNVVTTPPPRDTIQNLVHASIETQALSEVPIALFFSGGVDSSVIAERLRDRLTSMTVRYAGNEMAAAGLQDDFTYGSRIAELLGLDLQVEDLEIKQQAADDILEQIRSICRGVEEPISDFTYYPSLLLSERARRSGNKVILSGMGADEMFLGYPRYLMVRYRSLLRWLAPVLRLAGPVARKLPSLAKKFDRLLSFVNAKDFAMGYSHLVGYFSLDEIKGLIKNPDTIVPYQEKLKGLLAPANRLDDTKKAMYLDLFGFLAHNFIVADKSSMAHSIELRVPLATRDILSKNFHEPVNRLMGFVCLKKSLKQMLTGALPRSLVYRRKTGFNPPMDGMIRLLGRTRIRSLLLGGYLNQYLNTSSVDSLIEQHFSGVANNTYKLWQLLYLHFWMEFIQEPG